MEAFNILGPMVMTCQVGGVGAQKQVSKSATGEACVA
jgi:hypothetical protein